MTGRVDSIALQAEKVAKLAQGAGNRIAGAAPEPASASNAVGERLLQVGHGQFDSLSGELVLDGRTVRLRPRTAALLTHLVRNPDRVVGKDELLQTIWPDVIVTEDSLVQCVKEIRQALGMAGRDWIRTVPRQGYAFVAETTKRSTATAATGPEETRPRWRTRGGAIAAVALLAAAVAAWWLLGKPAAPSPPLSIAVLPIVSRNGDPQQDYLAEALTEEITIDLSRIPDSFVIGRSSAESYRGRKVDARQVGRELGVRYVLEGSFDRFDNEIRLSLQLVATTSGRTLWAERFDGQLQDLAGLHRQVTGTVAHSLQLRLVETESTRAGDRPATDAAAHDLALKAWSLLRRRTPEAVATARELLLRAVAQDARSALAWALLADSYTADLGFRAMHLRAATRDEWLQRAVEAADRAYALNPNHPAVLAARAHVLSRQGRSESALLVIQRLIALNRNEANGWWRLSYANSTLGRAKEAIEAGHEAIRLSPRDANLAGFYIVIAAAHLHLGHDAEALDWARKSALEQPDFSVAHSWIASAAANAGDLATARTALAEFRRLQPNYTINSFRDEKLCANSLCLVQRERYYEGLRKAGLPD